VRGFRVEPGEVEAALAAHPDVAAAVVMTTDGPGADVRLAAYLVPADQSAGLPSVAELRGYLRGRLPEFMVPAMFTELASLPLMANGKLDRAALPAADGARPGLEEFVPPSGVTEELLAGIWGQVLDIDRISASASFFDLGGNSLVATRLISRIRVVFEVEVPLEKLLDQPTLTGLAAVIDELAPGVAAPPVVPVARDRRLPLSFAQQRLWFLSQMEPGSVEYNAPMPERLTEDLDVWAMGMALAAVVARHEVLRTRLVAGPDGVADQVIDPPAPVPLPVADVSGQPDPPACARALVATDAAAPFDLAAGPLIRACLIRLAPDDHVLALSVHHVVCDEWSAEIFRRELSLLYEAFLVGRPDPLPALPVQYADFAVWQRGWLAGDVLTEQLGYWRQQLSGAPVLELPADRPRPPVRSSSGAMVEFRVPAQTMARLRAAAREAGATMFMTLLAGYAVLLSRYSGLDDVVIGTPVANRNRAEVEDLIGFFVNTLVMRADLAAEPSFTELLGRVRTMALGAYAHQDLPFERLVDELVTERDRSRTPLFEAFFHYVARPPGQGPVPGGAAGPAAPAPPGAQANGEAGPETLAVRFDLSLGLSETNGGLAGGIQYCTALFDHETVAHMAGHLVALLGAVAADGEQRVGELALLTPDQRDLLVRGWNDTAAAPPAAGGVPALIAARADAGPDAVAIV
jgi:acyl carrier protein